MEKDLNVYRGLDNRDLKLRNMEDWEFPSRTINPKVTEILNQVKGMEPGEMKKTATFPAAEAKTLHWALQRAIKRHSLDVKVAKQGGVIFLKRGDGE